MKTIFISLTCFISFISLNGQNTKTDSLLQLAREDLAVMKFSKAMNQLNLVEKQEALNTEMLYLKAELYLLKGMEAYFTYLDKLVQMGSNEQVSILKAKHCLFIGSESYDSLYAEYSKKYPQNAELVYCDWLNHLNSFDFEFCKKTVSSISNKILFSFAPYLALYYKAWDTDYKLALDYLDTLELMVGNFHQSKYRKILELLAISSPHEPTQDLIELTFSWCGSGMGYYLILENGDSLKIELDTGTGYNLLSIHDFKKGQSIPGKDLIVIKEGIQYNYMDAPKDLFYKTFNLSKPPYNKLLFGYFDGRFSKADGCASPFIFKNYAFQIDPIDQKVFLRSHDNIERYLQHNKEHIELIPYQLRNGWFYIPCKVNGKEIMMMIETGSRNINFNKLSVQELGLEAYESTIKWKGKDYKLKKVDCTIEIGTIKYQIKGGFVTDFVLGNWHYGVASAGDIGPDFLKNYVFTIDPFHKQIIFEIPEMHRY